MGHFKSVGYGGGGHADISPKSEGQINLKAFAYVLNKLSVSAVQKVFGGEEYSFLTWDLNNDSVKYYKTGEAYLLESKSSCFWLPDNFQEFDSHYKRHWNGCRFWTRTTMNCFLFWHNLNLNRQLV